MMNQEKGHANGSRSDLITKTTEYSRQILKCWPKLFKRWIINSLYIGQPFLNA